MNEKKSAQTRIYKINGRAIEATSPAQALVHAYKPEIRLMSASEVSEWYRSGKTVELSVPIQTESTDNADKPGWVKP